MLTSRVSGPETISRVLWFLAALLNVFLLPAQEPAAGNVRVPTPDEVCAAAETPRIEALRFEGLKKTKRDVVLRAVDAKPGDPYTEAVRTEIRRELLNLGLFDRVEVEPPTGKVVDPKTVVTIAVRERWTLVPIPYFVTSSGGTSGGLFLIESNLFGYNKQLITGGAYGSAGFNGILIYSDPSILGSDFLGSTAVSAARSEEEAVTLDGETLDSWEAFNTGGTLRLGYRLLENLTISTSLAANRREFDRPRSDAGESEAVVYHGGEISYSVREPVRYFAAGYNAAVEGEYEIGGGGDREWRVAATWEQNFPLFTDHRLRYALRAEEGEAPLRRRTRLGGSETQRTIDRSTVPVERYLTGGITYEFPVYRPDWGTVTLLGFYEGGVLHGEPGYHGPGGGFRLYVSRVTLPALGFDLAYRATADLWLFSFSIGMSM